MSNTEERVVNMRFNNADFKKAAADTQKSLADVNKAVDSAGKTKGLMDLSKQMSEVQVSASAMSVGVAASLGTVVSSITNAGLAMAKSVAIDPITQGFSEYGELLTKQNVIMNATGKSANEVKGYLNELNTFSDKTIYSFSNMTASITKFVNAGVPLDQATKSIRGIANAAAFSGATTEEANRAMYAFSQSMSTGFIMLNDWMQIENANMATQGFKEQLLLAGEAAGTLTKQGNGWVTQSGKFVSSTKGWREGLQEQWATTEVLNSALEKYTDTSTKLGREASKAATEVRTFGAFMDTLKESVGSGFSQVFTGLIGGLGEATTMWTGLSQAIGGVVTKFFNFAAGALRVWRNMGGAEKVLQGFKNILSPIAALLGTVEQAWREAFPRSGRGAGEGLYGLSVAFEALTRPLQLLAYLIQGTQPLMVTFFQVIRLGATVIGRVAGLVADFVRNALGLQDLKPGNNGFLAFVKDIVEALGEAAAKVQTLLDKGASLKEAFGSVDINLPNMPALPNLPSLPSMGGDEQASGLDKVTDKMHELAGATKDVGEASQDSSSKGLFDFGAMMSGIGSFLVKMGAGIKNLFSQFSWTDVVSAFNTAIFATMGYQIITTVNAIKNAFKGFSQIMNFKEGLLDNLTTGIKAFQTQARAELIKSIAIALLLLAASLWILSKIPADKLATGLATIGTMAFIMSKAMSSMTASITKMDGAKAGIKMVAVSIAIMALAGAMILLATAFIIFNHVDTASVVKGVVTMFVAMKLIENLGNLSKDAYKNLIGGALAITAVAGAMLLLAAALLLFKLVDWGSMSKAGAALAGLTLAVGALALIPYEGIAKVGVALLAASGGLILLATALIMFKKVDVESMVKAGVALAALAIAIAIIMAEGGPASAAVILALAGSMVLLAASLLMFNNVEWASLGKLALALTVLSVALLAVTGILYLMAPVIPVMILFGLALVAIGVGMLAFAGAMAIAISLGAAGVAAFAALATGAAVAVAVFLQTLAQEAPIMKQAFLAILQEMIDTIVEAVPMIIQGIKDLFAAVAAEFSNPEHKKGAGKAGTDMTQSLGDKIKAKMPMIVEKAKEIILAFLRGIKGKASAIAAEGALILAALIRGLASKVGTIVDAAVDLIIAFAKGISKGYSDILKAGVRLIADFLHALADTIRSGSGLIGSGITDVIDAFKDVGVDMVQGIINGIGSMAGQALSAMADLAGSMLQAAKDKFKINSPSKETMEMGKSLTEGLIKGVASTAGSAIVTVASMMVGTIALANEYMSAYLQDLDQKAKVARGKADGLAAAAQRAAAAAQKTKGKADDKAAKKLANAAEKADKKADAAEAASKSAQAAQDRADEWEEASLSEKALIRSQDAQNQIEAAKAAKAKAAQDRVQAAALQKEARSGKYNAKQKKAMLKEAERLRKDAKAQDDRVKELMAAAQNSAADALKFQGLAGAELSAAFQAQYDQEARDDAEAAAFEKLSSAEKAKKKREEAARLQAESEQALREAQVLAYSDIEAANERAQQAMEMANLAREALDQAREFEGNGGGPALELSMTEAAAAAFNNYSDLYDAAVAAAAGNGTIFNQYNTSPESLNASEIYRKTNNLLTHAVGQVTPTAA